MKKTNITYYKLPLSCIPFKEILSLEEFSLKYAYCKAISLKNFMGDDYYLVSVFDYWKDVELNSIIYFEKMNLLFGEVLSTKFSTRGELKCETIIKFDSKVEKSVLPHLRYCSDELESSNANWFYLKNGEYLIFSAIKSQRDKVKHLEDLVLYGDPIIRLRIVIELLKRNIKKGSLKLNRQQFESIAFIVLKSNPSFAKSDDDLIKDGVKNWLQPMLSMPLYEDIPKNTRGRVLYDI